MNGEKMNYVSIAKFEQQVFDKEGVAVNVRHPLLDQGFTKDTLFVPEYFEDKLPDSATVADLQYRLFQHTQKALPHVDTAVRIKRSE